MRERLPTDLVGRLIANKFAVDRILAVGGMGTVYLARQLSLDRPLAVKVLTPALSHDPEYLERFKREALAASRLDHPSSVRVIDFGQDEDGMLYLAMEYVEGPTLLGLLRDEWPLGEERIVHLLGQVLGALAQAHELGIVHRDIKPENILVLRRTGDDGEAAEIAKVCDFGIAKRAGEDEPRAANAPLGRITVAGVVVGTPDYFSPEQAQGHPLDGRSDLYAVGVVLYQLLTRRLPFDADTPLKIALLHVTRAPVPPSAYVAVSPALEAVCLRAMSKDVADRYQSARELRSALREAIGWRPAPATTTALAPTPAPRALPPMGEAPRTQVTTRELLPWGGRARGRLAWAAAAMAAVAIAAVLATRPPSAPAAEGSAAAPPSGPLPSPAARPRSARAKARATGVVPTTGTPLALGEAHDDEALAAPPPDTARPRRPGTKGTPTPPGTSRPRTRQAPRPSDGDAVLPPSAPVMAPAPERQPQRQRQQDSRAGRTAVALGAIGTTGALSSQRVRAVLGEAAASLSRCYREALAAESAPTAGSATLELAIDGGGAVIASAVTPATLPAGLKACWQRVARAAPFGATGPGIARATVTINFIAGS